MKIKRFEDSIAWQKAQGLAVEIYVVFKMLKDYGFKEQVCRASVSISNNIAEGFDRSSLAEFSRFLYIALGSCSEVKSMLYLAEKLKYIDEENRDLSINKATEISMIITGLIESISPHN